MGAAGFDSRPNRSCNPLVGRRGFDRIKTTAAGSLGDFFVSCNYPYRMICYFRKCIQSILIQGFAVKIRSELFAPKSPGGAACQ